MYVDLDLSYSVQRTALHAVHKLSRIKDHSKKVERRRKEGKERKKERKT